jgi:hypothetical protein
MVPCIRLACTGVDTGLASGVACNGVPLAGVPEYGVAFEEVVAVAIAVDVALAVSVMPSSGRVVPDGSLSWSCTAMIVAANATRAIGRMML